MNVTIIGAGNMGRGIGTRAAAGGNSVTFVDANPEAAQQAATDVQKAARNAAKVSAASLGDVQLGDIVVLAVWYGTNIEIARQLGSKLAGKVVVDIANPLNATYDGLATAPDSSSAEDLAKVVAPGARVVKAFNTTYAGTLISGQVDGRPLDVFIAGDDAEVEGKSRTVRQGGRHAPDRYRRPEPFPSDRRDAAPAHCHPGHAWHKLGKCDQDPGLIDKLMIIPHRISGAG